MSKDLHPSILTFFQERMASHNNVTSVTDISTEEHFLFSIERAKNRDKITVWLSDAYLFTDADLYAKPDTVMAGDFIIVAKPEGGFFIDHSVIEQHRIGVGMIGKFMGALNKPQMWTYLTPEEREKLARQRSVG